LLTRALVAKI